MCSKYLNQSRISVFPLNEKAASESGGLLKYHTTISTTPGNFPQADNFRQIGDVTVKIIQNLFPKDSDDYRSLQDDK